MSLASDYLESVVGQIRQIETSQMDGVRKAGEYVCEALCAEKWLYVFGTGHSHMIAEELFYRAGGLARIRPMLLEELMLHVSASRSTQIERDPAVVERLLKAYPMGAGDVLLVASNSGRNPVPIELALQARSRGVVVIALINKRHSHAFESRHESGKKLGDIADLVLDNCGVVGDACVELPKANLSIGAASTVTGALLVEMVASEAIERAQAKGWNLEVFCSSNAGRESDNEALLERYTETVRHL